MAIPRINGWYNKRLTLTAPSLVGAFLIVVLTHCSGSSSGSGTGSVSDTSPASTPTPTPVPSSTPFAPFHIDSCSGPAWIPATKCDNASSPLSQGGWNSGLYAPVSVTFNSNNVGSLKEIDFTIGPLEADGITCESGPEKNTAGFVQVNDGGNLSTVASFAVISCAGTKVSIPLPEGTNTDTFVINFVSDGVSPSWVGIASLELP